MDIPVCLCLHHSQGRNAKENAEMLVFPTASPQSHVPDHLSGSTQQHCHTPEPWELQSLAGTFCLCTGHSSWTTQQVLKEAPGCPSEQHFNVEWSRFLERVHSSVTPATLAWQPDLPVLLLIIALKKRKQNCYQSEWGWFTILSFACKVSNSNTKHLSVH